MKIKQEQWESMKQLDKIEYMIREDRIKVKYKESIFWELFKIILPLDLFYLLFMAVAYGSFGRLIFNSLAYKLPLLFGITFIGLLVCLLLDLLMAFKQNKDIETLQSKFFHIELNKETQKVK